MSDHNFVYINDDFSIALSMKGDSEDNWFDAQVWGRMVEAILETMRTPIAIPMQMTGEQEDDVRESWKRKFAR